MDIKNTDDDVADPHTLNKRALALKGLWHKGQSFTAHQQMI